MKAHTEYQCEICGHLFDNAERAIQCENSHGFPKEIITKKYKYEDMARYGYPSFVKIKMTNGKICEYVFNTVIKL